jgi:hypothetical protein
VDSIGVSLYEEASGGATQSLSTRLSSSLLALDARSLFTLVLKPLVSFVWVSHGVTDNNNNRNHAIIGLTQALAGLLACFLALLFTCLTGLQFLPDLPLLAGLVYILNFPSVCLSVCLSVCPTRKKYDRVVGSRS